MNSSSDEQLRIRRIWQKDLGQWLGPLDYNNEKLSGIDNRYRFQSYSNNDEASIMRIKNLTTSDQGIYLCSLWVILDNETIIPKNEAFLFNLTILSENGFVPQNNELIETSTVTSMYNINTSISIINQTATTKTTRTTLMNFLTSENDADLLSLRHYNDNNVGININDTFDDNGLMDNVNEQQIYYENELDDEDDSAEDSDEVELPDLKDQEVWNIPLNCKWFNVLLDFGFFSLPSIFGY